MWINVYAGFVHYSTIKNSFVLFGNSFDMSCIFDCFKWNAILILYIIWKLIGIIIIVKPECTAVQTISHGQVFKGKKPHEEDEAYFEMEGEFMWIYPVK